MGQRCRSRQVPKVSRSNVNTFLERYDFSSKTIVLFATFGGSGLDKAVAALRDRVSKDTKRIEGRLLNGRLSPSGLRAWHKAGGLLPNR